MDIISPLPTENAVNLTLFVRPAAPVMEHAYRATLATFFQEDPA